jgi:hypothetical protein
VPHRIGSFAGREQTAEDPFEFSIAGDPDRLVDGAAFENTDEGGVRRAYPGDRPGAAGNLSDIYAWGIKHDFSPFCMVNDDLES